MSIISCYRILGLSPTASQREVHRAYGRLAMLYHPDHAGDSPDNHYLFCQITQAYNALKMTFQFAGSSRRIELCPKCGRVVELYQGMDGGHYCADCLLPGRKHLLPLQKFDAIRCTAAISLQAVAAYCVTLSALVKDWHLGLAAAACVLAALVALTFNVKTATVIERA